MCDQASKNTSLIKQIKIDGLVGMKNMTGN